MPEKVNVEQSEVEEVVMGNDSFRRSRPKLQTGCNPGAGIPKRGTSFLNKCAARLKSVLFGQIHLLGRSDVVLAGGMESMSDGSLCLKKNRWEPRWANVKFVDLFMIMMGVGCF